MDPDGGASEEADAAGGRREDDAGDAGSEELEEQHTTCDVASAYASRLEVEGDAGTADENDAGDGGVGDAGDEPGGDEEADSCVARGVFRPGIVKPAAPPRPGVCTQQAIASIASACLDDPFGFDGQRCAHAREVSSACSRCIFSDRRDSTWKAIMLTPCEPGWVRFNQAGCIEHTSGVPGCGEELFVLNSCLNAVCGSCSTDEEIDHCFEEAVQTTCFEYLVSGECMRAAFETRAEAVGPCFADGTTSSKELFEYIAAQQCPP